jgi:hypothetical protein
MSDETTGRATRMGWKRRKSGDKFEVVIELDKPPGWPIDVVWNATPIQLSLKTADRNSTTNGD